MSQFETMGQRTKYNVQTANGTTWTHYYDEGRAKECARDFDEEDPSNAPHKVVEETEYQSRYYLLNDETGEETTVTAYDESSAKQEAAFEWAVGRSSVSVLEVDEPEVDA